MSYRRTEVLEERRGIGRVYHGLECLAEVEHRMRVMRDVQCDRLVGGQTEVSELPLREQWEMVLLSQHVNLDRGLEPLLLVLDDGQGFYFHVDGAPTGVRGDQFRILRSGALMSAHEVEQLISTKQ